MSEDVDVLDEVVVTALGLRREQKALSYNVQQVKSEQLLTVKDANFINSLDGKVAGVTINSSSAGIGGASKVVMRGTKSIEQSSNALYVTTASRCTTSEAAGTPNSARVERPKASPTSTLTT